MVQPVQAPVEIIQENHLPHKALLRKHIASAKMVGAFLLKGCLATDDHKWTQMNTDREEGCHT